MIYLIPLAIIIVSLIIIVVIIVRKFPNLAAINIATIVAEREAEIKHKIISERLRRKIMIGWNFFLKLIRPVGLMIQSEFRKLYQRVLALEKHYQERRLKLSGGSALEQKIKVLFSEAADLINQGELARAEKNYIEIISLDKKNLKAYENLGNLYVKKKQYREAEETLNFVLKHDPNDASVIVSLGEIALAQDKPEIAVNFFEKAVVLRPNNPKYLDFLIETSIMVGNQDLARRTFDHLSQVNPENQKLPSFKERIEKLGKK